MHEEEDEDGETLEQIAHRNYICLAKVRLGGALTNLR